MKMNRTNKLLLCLTLSFILFSCKDDNNSDTILRLDAAELKQTSWTGQRIQSYNGGENLLYSEVGIIFYTTETGRYDIKYKTDPEPSDYEHFEYYVDGKMLFIEGNSTLRGYWLLIEKGKDKMVFEQSTGGEFSYKETLILERKH